MIYVWEAGQAYAGDEVLGARDLGVDEEKVTQKDSAPGERDSRTLR